MRVKAIDGSSSFGATADRLFVGDLLRVRIAARPLLFFRE
jgi:hypothetical protein